MSIDGCYLCPRQCGVNRKEKKGYCNSLETIRIARVAPHYYEEPCISGTKGSGAVFFVGCNLKCVYCQNHEISRGDVGKEYTVKTLAEAFLSLQEMGTENINLVTGTHYVPQIIDALELARKQGLTLPVVYNTSGYETVENIDRLDGYVDLYLPDFKYITGSLAEQFSHAKDYPEVAKKALDRMVSQRKRVIVRHLVLPGHTKESMMVLDYLYGTYQDAIEISIMSQFTPVVPTPYPELNRKLTKREYNKVVDYALKLGIERAYIQEGDVAKESFIPDFMVK